MTTSNVIRIMLGFVTVDYFPFSSAPPFPEAVNKRIFTHTKTHSLSLSLSSLFQHAYIQFVLPSFLSYGMDKWKRATMCRHMHTHSLTLSLSLSHIHIVAFKILVSSFKAHLKWDFLCVLCTRFGVI